MIAIIYHIQRVNQENQLLNLSIEEKIEDFEYLYEILTNEYIFTEEIEESSNYNIVKERDRIINTIKESDTIEEFINIIDDTLSNYPTYDNIFFNTLMEL